MEEEWGETVVQTDQEEEKDFNIGYIKLKMWNTFYWFSSQWNSKFLELKIFTTKVTSKSNWASGNCFCFQSLLPINQSEIE